jgi:hypothetical protein
MIITVDGRPLNGPSTKISNTLKDESEEPLMKGGSIVSSFIGFAKKNPTQTLEELNRKAREEFEEKRNRPTGLGGIIQSHNESSNLVTSQMLNQNMGLLRGVASQESDDAIKEAIKKSERRTKRMNKIHKYIVSMLFYYVFYLTGEYIRESIGLFFYWLIWIFLNFFSLLMLFIIFNICLIIIMVIQKSLNISHVVVGGIAKGMQTAIDKAGFRIFGKNIKLLGFLQGPTNKVKESDRKIPNTAREVIEAIVLSFFEPYLK